MAESALSQESPKKAKRQLIGLAGLRALAAIGIVFYHLNQHRTTAGLAEWNWNLYKLTELLPMIVSFFFIVGGALHSLPFWRVIFLRKSEDSTPIRELLPSPKWALIDRFFRIAPAYYGALLATFGIVWTLQWVGSSDFLRLFAGLSFLSWTHPLTFFPVEMNGPLWFISYDIVGGLLVLAVMHLFARIPRKTIPLAFMVVVGLLLAGNFWFRDIAFPKLPGIVSEWFPTYNPFIFGLHFLFGITLGAAWMRAEIADSKPSVWYDAAFLLTIVGLFAFLWNIRFEDIFAVSYPRSPYHFPFTSIFLAISLFTVTGTHFIGGLLDNSLTKWIANISYSLYLWHALVIGLLCRWVFGNGALDIVEWWMLAGATFALAIPMALLSEKYIEQAAMAWKKAHLGK